MNFGSEFALVDSDEEDEVVCEDAMPQAGPLRSLSGGVAAPAPPPLQFIQPGRGYSTTPLTPPPPPPSAWQYLLPSAFDATPQQPPLLPQYPPLAEQHPIAPPSSSAGYPMVRDGGTHPRSMRWFDPSVSSGGDNGGGGNADRSHGERRQKATQRAPSDFGWATHRHSVQQTSNTSVPLGWGNQTNAGEGTLPMKSASAPPRSWTRKVDTNILNVDMASLGKEAPVATGDPTVCSSCRAYLSVVSTLRPSARTTGAAASNHWQSSDQSSSTTGTPDVGCHIKATKFGDQADVAVYDWTCEFCGTVNAGMELHDMEKPLKGQQSVDYVLEPAPVSSHAGDSADATAKMPSQEEGDETKKDESAVLFVIDTSASMKERSSAVEGHVTLRGDRNVDSTLDTKSKQLRTHTCFTRLQQVQAVVDAQLEEMAKSTPHRRAGIMSFDMSLSLIGDGLSLSANTYSRSVSGTDLFDMAALRQAGRRCPISRPVSETRGRLSELLFDLMARGTTALGPAVVSGISMLKGSGRPGSRMVLCTDGMANNGVGTLNGLKTDKERSAAESFYESLGHEAAASGIAVDVVSVDSEYSDLENLGAMAAASGGTVTKVKASELASNFAGILATPILASQVSVRVILHKGLMFRNSGTKAKSGNTLNKIVGNVTRDTELSFEYQVRSKAEREALGINTADFLSSSVNSSGPPAATAAFAPSACGSGDNERGTSAHLPFQVQILYTRPDGVKCVRVLTKTQRVTKDKRTAEKAMKMDVIAGHASSAIGRMASEGAYQSSRVTMRAWSNVMSRNANCQRSLSQVSHFGTEMAQLDSQIIGAQKAEGAPDKDAGGKVDDAQERSTAGKQRKATRSTNDNLSFHLYSASSSNSKRYHTYSA